MAKRTPPKKDKAKLKITANVVESLQDSHGIKNLFDPTGDESEKMNSMGFMLDIYFQGSRKWENPPSMDEIKEDVGLDEIAEAMGAVFSGGKS